MITRPSVWRHLLVAIVILVAGAAAYTGLVGEPRRAERIDGLQVTVSPKGEDGLQIHEVIDQDFGSTARHGPELVVPDDFGTPTDVRASSPDAPDEAAVAYTSDGLRIRVGDPDETIKGQHRYEITYTLPSAELGEGELNLDAVGAKSDIPIDDVDVYVTGFTLADPTCAAGDTGASGGCTLADAGAAYHAHVPHLAKRQGITIGGRITGRTEISDPPARPIPERRPDRKLLFTGLALLLGIGTALVVRRLAVRRGSNEVTAGGAADAAFGGPPPATAGVAAVPIRRISDAELAKLATIEFTPPPGLEPWQGTVLLREKIDPFAAIAWFSGAAADEVITIESEDGIATKITKGPRYGNGDEDTRQALKAMFLGGDSVSLRGYSPRFSAAWSKVTSDQAIWIAKAGWWRRTPRLVSSGPMTPALRVVIGVALLPVVVPLLGLAAVVLGLLGTLGGILGLVAVSVGAPYVAARIAYSPLLPGRTAIGSAMALRVESFRRFLVESEGQHVEWAWSQGLLRQYTAWAVALGAADAWRGAMAAANVPPAEVTWSRTVLSPTMVSTFTAASTEPSASSSSSGSSSSSSFSSSSVGGGGGGGSHGSW